MKYVEINILRNGRTMYGDVLVESHLGQLIVMRGQTAKVPSVIYQGFNTVHDEWEEDASSQLHDLLSC